MARDIHEKIIHNYPLLPLKLLRQKGEEDGKEESVFDGEEEESGGEEDFRR